MSSCPDDDTILAFVEARLTPSAARPLHAHVEGCDACRRLIADAARAHFGAAPPELAAESGFGRYRIVKKLGSGAMGVVYLAHDAQLDRPVALKLLLPYGEDDAASRARLLREAKAMAKISHPNVVTVHDAGEVDGQAFVSMELVEGQTLSQWLRTPRPAREVVKALVAAGHGLCAAHAAGLVHRDFKPGNVLVGADGRPRVTDFGLARRVAELTETVSLVPLGDPLPPTRITQTGAVVGTPAYMAPEQFDGAPADARTDQFAFAVTAFEGLYGARPFAGETYDELLGAMRAQRLRDVPAARVPEEVRRVVLKGLAARPDERYAGLGQLLEALERAARPGSRRWVLPAAMAAAAGAAAIAWLAVPRAEAPLPAPIVVNVPAPVVTAPVAPAPAPAAVVKRHEKKKPPVEDDAALKPFGGKR